MQGAQGAMSQAIAVGNGVVFHPKGQVQIKDSILTADYSVSGSRTPLLGQVTTVVGESGRGVSFMAGSGPQDAERLRSALSKISASLSLVQPKPKSSDSQARETGSWMEQLSGRKLSRFFTRSGYTEEEYIWLCPEGLFFRSSQSGGFGGGASGAFQAENAGTWTVVSDHRKTYFFGLSPTGHRSRQPRLWRGIGGNGSVQRLNRPQIEHRQRVGERRGAGELIVPPP